MALSMSGHPVLEPIQPIYEPADARRQPAPLLSKATALDVSMQSRATFIRRREFQVDDRRQRVALMERMIADFDCLAADLDREILIEQERAKIHDPAHFAYPTYAKAAILRRDNLKRSADDSEPNSPKPRRHSSGLTWLLDANETGESLVVVDLIVGASGGSRHGLPVASAGHR